MRGSKLLLGFLALLASAVVVRAEGNVVDLTPDNFDSIVDGSKHVLVEFFAPWCGHCKSLAPIYEELGDAFAHGKSSVIIAKVDADQHKTLGSRFGVQGFPTLKWFPKGGDLTKPQAYEQGRDLASLSKFITENSGIPAKIKESVSHVIALTEATFPAVALNESIGALVEFYAPWCGHCKSLAPTYEKLGSAFANEPTCAVTKVDATEQAGLASTYKIEGYPTIKFFPAGAGQKPVDYPEGRTLEAFVAFLNKECGTFRTPQGTLMEQAGVVEEVLPLLKQFVSTNGKSQREAVIQTLQGMEPALLAKPKAPYYQRSVPYYARVLQKILDKGDEYAGKEMARLEKLLSNGDALTSAKVDDIAIRRNVLRSVLETGSESVPVREEL